MEYPDSRDAEHLAAAGAGYSANFNGSASARPSAIERQLALAAARSKAHWDSEHAARRKPHSSIVANSLAVLLVLLLLIAAGLALLDSDSGRVVQKVVGAIRLVAVPAMSNSIPPNKGALSTSKLNASATGDSTPVADALPAKNDTSNNSSRPWVDSSSDAASQKAPSSPATAAGKVANNSAPAELSIPVADVSVRNQPELLEQLVRIYRAKLAANPNDATVRAALAQLQQRSLSELQNIILEGDEATAVVSMQVVSRLFPEAADNVRYKYLVARTERMHSQDGAKPAVKSEGAPAAAAAAAPKASASLPQNTASAIKSGAENAAAALLNGKTESSGKAESAGKATESIESSKPEIRAVSITPGAMIRDRFVPDVEGNAVMLEVNYRNFDKLVEDRGEVSLIARLGIPGYSNVLAEAPIEILGDRGTKSVVMTTLMPAAADEYKLNFILNGEFLASRTVHPSR